jgi:hypothetical protein
MKGRDAIIRALWEAGQTHRESACFSNQIKHLEAMAGA